MLCQMLRHQNHRLRTSCCICELNSDCYLKVRNPETVQEYLGKTFQEYFTQQGSSLSQCLDVVRRTLSSSPSVLRVSPISTTLSRRVESGQPIRSFPHVSKGPEPHGAAIIICNTKNRDDWNLELEDAKYIVKTQLRLQVVPV